MRRNASRSPSLWALASLCAVAACTPRSTLDTPADAADVVAVDLAVVDVVTDDDTNDAPSLDAPADADVDATPVDATPVDAPADATPVDATPADATPADVVDAPPADAPPADVPADAPPADAPDGSAACMSDRECSARMQVCDVARMTCVDCLRDGDCIAPGQSCVGFRCVTPVRCTSSRTCPGQVCDTMAGVCVDCVANFDCPDGQVCSRNACVAAPPTCRSDRDCSARMQVCNPTRMACVDCNADRDCPTGRLCNPDGTCVPQTCAPGSVTCADETTRRVCSSDGRMFTSSPCPAAANGTSRCADGACVLTCTESFYDCDANPTNGCETDVRVNPSHCGRCGLACNATGGSATCAAGACGIVCGAGRGDCDANLTNGCETNTTSSNTHCGRCGAACGAGQTCTSGVCVTTSCTAGRTLCGGVCVDVGSDLANCGACGSACAPPSATGVCARGTCNVMACAAGRANCNGAVTDGCEVDVTSSLTNCGGCGVACAAPNGAPSCVAGVCGVATCTTGYADCDHAAANGCEVDTRVSATNCGACGRACAAGQVCTAGACAANPCSGGATLCGSACVNTASDTANCGGCGRACAAGQACLSGVCSAPPLRFVLTWNVTADLDLSTVNAAGTVISYAAPMAGGGVFGMDSMATGPETITWSATPATGTYSICVIPYALTTSASYTLQVLRAGAVVATRTGTLTTAAAPGTVCSRTSTYRVLDYVY